MARPATLPSDDKLTWDPGAAEIASLWRAISTEPGTGVTVLALDGRILYANDEVAKMMFGPGAAGASYIGAGIRDLFPRTWADEHEALLARLGASGEPIVTRTLWQGVQLLSWLHRIEGHTADDAGDGGDIAPATPDRVLVVTRRVAGKDDLKRLGLSGVEVVESGVLRLGPLDLLSPRELEVLAMVGQGLSLDDIARLLFRSPKTIAHHREQLGKKLVLSDRLKLAEVAWRAGLTVRDVERTRV